MKRPSLKLIAVLLISVTIIAYEIAIMRSFSVGSWSNFGSMIISIALLGIGLAGTILTFIRPSINRNPDSWLNWTAFLFIPGMTIAHVLAQLVPFNPLLIVNDATQFIWIGIYYLLYSIPFFISAMFIGVAFIALSDKIHKLYFFNMIGSGLGGFFILGCMWLLPPDLLILPLLVLALISVIFCLFSNSPPDQAIIKNNYSIIIFITIIVIVFTASIFIIIFAGEINVSEFKPISFARDYPDSKLVHYSYGPTGEMHVYDSSYFHFAPGLSDNAVFNLKSLPRKAFLGLYIDGEGPIGIMRKLSQEEEEYIDFLPMTAPYLLLNNPHVCIVRLGGGTSIFTALHHHAETIHVVETNYTLINLLGQINFFKNYNGNLLNHKKVKVIRDEPRAFCATTRKKFDLVEISLIDSIGLTQTGGYPLVENYTYTAEAFNDYMSCLNKDGLLSITVWNRLDPPRNVPKLLTTIVHSLQAQGIKNPQNRIYVFHLILSTATIIVKNSDFTEEEINILNTFCQEMAFEVCYHPYIKEPLDNFNDFLKLYEKSPSNRKTINNPTVLYYYILKWFFYNLENKLYEKYVFDIRPATDDKPYYTGYLKPEKIAFYLNRITSISEEWGYLLLLATFGLSLLFGAIIIFIPLIGRFKELFKGRKGTWGVIIYYACLGLGYMLIEIFLIQKMVFFLAEPIFSVSIVLTTMLTASGLGSLLAARFLEKKIYKLRLVVTGISACILFYIFTLSPLLQSCLGFSLFTKMLLTTILVLPLALLLGMPFPLGLSTLTKKKPGLLPWAWGMNGALSVTGTLIARLFSIINGFTVILIMAIFVYVIAGIVFPANKA